MRRVFPAISLLALLACSGKPEFTYDVRPGAQVEALWTIAFDPREVAWVSEGQRPVRAESLKRLVQETLEARGFRLVAPEAADMWVDVIAMKPDKGEGSRGAGKPGAGGHGGGRSGGGKSGGGMRGGQGAERDRTTHLATEAAPSQRVMAFEGFDPGGELTFTVQILARENVQTLWIGSVHLPPQKKDKQLDHEAVMRAVVHQLMQPLPRNRGPEMP